MSDIKDKLAKLGITPKKAFGQNFLINRQVIGKIVEQAKSLPHRDLIEIGPGVGALTEPLLEAGLKPRLVEFDRELADHWRALGTAPVIEGDALRVDWDEIVAEKDTLLVSNLPYQIATNLVVERCFGPGNLRWMILMFQKEVAQRLTAQPRTKEYGFVSVVAQLHFKMRKVADAAPRDFFPAPKVASRVLYFERLAPADLGEPFLKFVKRAFAQRRKFLLKNLAGSVDKDLLARLGLKETVRAEELTPAQFVRLYREH